MPEQYGAVPKETERQQQWLALAKYIKQMLITSANVLAVTVDAVMKIVCKRLRQ